MTWYTYLLIDPLDGEVFYVGKGHGKRMYTHVKEAKAGKFNGNARKAYKIREIIARGDKVIEQVFSRHTEEEEALDAEDLLIETLSGFGLTNIAGSRALERQERMELLLKRIKPFHVWVRTCNPAALEWASKFAGSALAFYQRFIKEIERESQRKGGNTITFHNPQLHGFQKGATLP